MIKVSGTNISLIRGDSGEIEIAASGAFDAGTYTFGVKRDKTWGDPRSSYAIGPITHVVPGDGPIIAITLTPEMTSLAPGKYFWGLRYTGSGSAYTIIRNGTFLILSGTVQPEGA